MDEYGTTKQENLNMYLNVDHYQTLKKDSDKKYFALKEE